MAPYLVISSYSCTQRISDVIYSGTFWNVPHIWWYLVTYIFAWCVGSRVPLINGTNEAYESAK